MAIEGPLKELGIHDVFQLLDLSRKTGKLAVTSRLRHNSGSVYFDNGTIVFAEIDSNPHHLGALLVASGKVSEPDLQRARDMQEQGDARRLGEILVEIDALTERELERHMRFQVEEVVFELLSWDEGFFSFAEGECEDVPAESRVHISTESLLMEGARRIDEWSRIERKIPHLGVIPRFSAGLASQDGYLDLLPFEWEVMAAIDNDRDVRTVANTLGRSEFEVAKTIFGLESAGVIALHEREATPEAESAAAAELATLVERAEAALASGDLEAARRLCEAAQTQFPHEAEVQCLLGRVDMARHVAEGAEEHFRRALRIDPMFAQAHRLLGNALALQGRYQEAVEWWQRWLTLGGRAEAEETEMEQVHEALQAVEKLDAILGQSYG
jgi:tetratricopeptide (TPR) repeat protein